MTEYEMKIRNPGKDMEELFSKHAQHACSTLCGSKGSDENTFA